MACNIDAHDFQFVGVGIYCRKCGVWKPVPNYILDTKERESLIPHLHKYSTPQTPATVAESQPGFTSAKRQLEYVER